MWRESEYSSCLRSDTRFRFDGEAPSRGFRCIFEKRNTRPTFLVWRVVKNGLLHVLTVLLSFRSRRQKAGRSVICRGIHRNKNSNQAGACRVEFSATSKIFKEISVIISVCNYSYLAKIPGTSSTVSLP